MSVTIPLANQTWPLFRLLTRENWSGKATSDAGWTVHPMQRRGPRRHGFRLIDYDRVALPLIGRARVAYDYGEFPDGIVGAAVNTTSGEPWDATSDSLTFPDLTGHEIRIQAAPKPATDSGTPAWRTVWFGSCEYVEDQGKPGAAIPQGTRIYHLVDGLYRASRWPLNRHGFKATDSAGSSSTYDNVTGFPEGYNTGAELTGGRGNRDASQYNPFDTVGVNYFTWPGAGTAWTDEEVVNHALSVTRPAAEPWFVLSGSTSLLAGSNAWPVKEGETAHDLLVRVCRRERGRGVVFLDWDDDSSAPEGPLTVRLRIRPQTEDDISYTPPVGTGVVLAGATTTGSTVAVDLIGDHRLVDHTFILGDRDQHRVDRLEVCGERLEVLATLAYVDGLSGGNGVSLEKRWSASDQTAFRLLAASARREEKWRMTYQGHGLPRRWTLQVMDGNNAASIAAHRVDFRCSDAGVITVPATTDLVDTSPGDVEVMDDLPLLEGYDYSGLTPARRDAATERGQPQRREPLVFIRKSADRYLRSDETTGEIALKIDKDCILVYDTRDDGAGTRYLSVSPTVDSLAGVYNHDQLVLTVGLRLPHRVRFAYGNPNGRRKRTIYIQDAHLWLASAGAIHDTNSTTGSASLGHAGRRSACGATAASPGILRDDRAGLAALAALAWAWYGTERRTATWALRCCGSLGTFEDEVVGDVAYPALGQTVTTIAANGQVHQVGTPITRLSYDNESGTTTWSSDWAELDFTT